MNEKQWTETIAAELREKFSRTRIRSCQIAVGRRIPYGFEIRSYEGDHPKPSVNLYETDLAILEPSNQHWKPRVIVEAKTRPVTTHDAITYSQKALSHKTVHPYVRYGIMLGADHTLPGRLYRHGAHFDFMVSFAGERPTESEMARFANILRAEIDASRKLEKIIYENRRRDRDHYTILHKKLILE